MTVVLQVAYPLSPVGPDAVGGAEQVLFHLERALAARGVSTVTVASEDSQISGTLVPVPRGRPPYDTEAISAARQRHSEAIRAALARWPISLVHMHGFDFDQYLPPPGIPVLATLHCPTSWYAPEALNPRSSDLWLNAVSRYQLQGLAQNGKLIGVVENGVPVDLFASHPKRRGFALVLARIAPEKGIREALEAAHLAEFPMLIAGELFPYPQHQRYFEQAIFPLLDQKRRWLGPIGFTRKRRLLAHARCVVIPSLESETSSLVLREAFAAGTPVVAFRRGALADAIENGRTGFLVESVEGIADAMKKIAALDGNACRAVAQKDFSLERMVDGYLDLYRKVIRLSGSTRARLKLTS